MMTFTFLGKAPGLLLALCRYNVSASSNTLRFDQNRDQLSPALIQLAFYNVLCTDANQMLQESMSLHHWKRQITGG
jgi:hypothetical protein